MNAKNNLTKALFSALLAISLVTPAQAKPWWRWPGKTPAAKTVQLALPSNNGGLTSVTVPSTPAKATSAKGVAGRRQAHDSAVNRLDDERIAADIARQF